MQKIGKFEVQGLLGRGAQSAVFLARDPDIDRRIAVKLLRLQGEPAEQRASLLREARSVGALRHPGIVPLFETGEHGGAPFLVFEHVEGGTLAQRLHSQGALTPESAARLLIEVLDALAHAHEAGMVHRDLKPSNILLDGQGRARVMDFGIACRIGDRDGPGAGLTGTPQYLAPEYVQRGEVGPQGDVYAAGLVLFEALFGQRAVVGDGVFQILHRVVNEPLVLPVNADQTIGERLLDVLAKATARDPSLRYSSARAMQQALRQYLQPDQDAGPEPGGSGSSTLDFLLRRMRHKSDFPAMSASITTINRLALSEQSDAASLANAILKDLALTNKVLRIANSVYYSRGGGRVSTVSRAIVLLGFETVRSLAISLMLFEHIQDKTHAQLLKDEFLRASLRGLLARSLSERLALESAEQAFVCGLFHNLGRLLAHYYFPEEAGMIDRLVSHEQCSADAAAVRVLGIGLRDLGIGIARSWGFPESLVQSMRAPPEGRLLPGRSEAERLGLLADCADRLGGLLEQAPAATRSAALTALGKRFAACLDLPEPLLEEVAATAGEGLAELARLLQITPGSSQLAALLPPPVPPAAAYEQTLPPLGLSTTLIPAEAADGEGQRSAAESPDRILSAGIQDISQALAEDSMSAADLLAAIAETVYRALAARRVLISLREGPALMRARHGLGEDIEEAMARMRFNLGGKDLFNLILSRDVDVLIRDASADKVRQHLPDWYRQGFDAASFIVLPMRHQNQPLAMIYAESPNIDGIRPGPETLNLLRTLRNQALLVLKLRR